MDKVVFSVLGYLIGFVFSLLLWGAKEGETGVIPNLRIIFVSKVLAIHHWMLFLILIFLILIIRNSLPSKLFYFLLGVFIGGLNHGLTYSDWYIVLKSSQ